MEAATEYWRYCCDRISVIMVEKVIIVRWLCSKGHNHRTESAATCCERPKSGWLKRYALKGQRAIEWAEMYKRPGMTYQKLADEVGYSASYVGYWVSLSKDPGVMANWQSSIAEYNEQRQ